MSLIELIGVFLGVPLFKKYWPFGGSWWNETHLNPQDKCSLTMLICESKERKSAHAKSLWMEMIYIFMFWIADFVNSGPLFKLTCMIWVYHLYAILVQQYNIIKAERRIKLIPVSTDIPKYDCPFMSSDIPENEEIKNTPYLITPKGIKDKPLYQVYYSGVNIGPLFTSAKYAVNFAQKLHASIFLEEVIIMEKYNDSKLREWATDIVMTPD